MSRRMLTDAEYARLNNMVTNYHKSLRKLGYIPLHLVDAYTDRYQIGMTEHLRSKHK